jgi:hypothetical protein
MYVTSGSGEYFDGKKEGEIYCRPINRLDTINNIYIIRNRPMP